MKNVKRFLALILCLVLVLPACALAAEGDAVIARNNHDGEGFNDYIEGMTSIDDTLYLAGYDGLYTYQIGDADVQSYPFNREALITVDENEEESWDASMGYGIFAKDGELYSIWIVYHNYVENDEWFYKFSHAVLLRMTIEEDGTAKLEPVQEYDWDGMLEYDGDYVYPRQNNGTLYLDGYLYIRSYDDNWNDAVYRLDVESGDIEQIEEMTNVYSMTSYKDGKVLVQIYTYEKPTQTEFAAYDPQSGTLETVAALEIPEYQPYSNVVYAEESNMIYYVTAGAVWQMNLSDGTKAEVSDMATSSYSSGVAPILLGDKYYVNTTYEGTVIRNIRPTEAEKSEYTLRVYDSSYSSAVNDAYYQFTNQHGEAMVILSRDWMNEDKILEDMMNRSSDWDVYVLNTNNSAYDAIYNRGYMAELSGSEKLTALSDSMYPTLQENIKYKGELVGIPIDVYSYTMGVNNVCLKKLGMTVDDIPKDWESFLRFLKDELPARLPDDGTVSLFYSDVDVRSARYYLYSAIMDDYQKYLSYVGFEKGFNTELLNTLLDLVNQIDFTTLGQPEEIDWENYEWTWDEAGYLLENGVGATPGDFYGSERVPLGLTMDKDLPFIVSLNGSVIYVNPFTKHLDEAIEFVESVADKLNNNTLYAAVPTMTQPIRASYYEENKQSMQDYIEDLEKQLAEADEADKQMLEDELNSMKDSLESFEDYSWEISQNGIDWYQQHNEIVILQPYSMIYSGEDSGEIYNLESQFIEGLITVQEFLKGLDRKVQMMILENS